ncbi:MAG: hypothetical protein AAB692_04745 [Patescibacteria group bacterium]
MRSDWAGHNSEGATVASDGFFPFTDGPEALINAGVTTIVAPKGGVFDDKVRAVCRNAGLTLVFLPPGKRGFAQH